MLKPEQKKNHLFDISKKETKWMNSKEKLLTKRILKLIKITFSNALERTLPARKRFLS